MIDLPFDLPDFDDASLETELEAEPPEAFEPPWVPTASATLGSEPGLSAGFGDWLSLDGTHDEAEAAGLAHVASPEEAAAELSRRLAAESSAASVLAAQGQVLPWL